MESHSGSAGVEGVGNGYIEVGSSVDEATVPVPKADSSLTNDVVVPRSYSPSRPPTSAEIDAVIANAIANAPPAPPAAAEPAQETINRSITPLMTNFLPASVGADGRVNLFVGNLPYRVRWQDLKDLFRKAGTVLRADVSLGPDNRSRGYGTVLLGSREDAARAIDRFNGFTWQTRTLEVRPDRLPPEYEAQPYAPHMHNGPPRGGPMYTYHNMSGAGHTPFSLPGNITPSHGPPWLPGQMPNHPHGPGRPPSHMSHPSFGSHHMGGMIGLPPGAHPINLSPQPAAMGISATSPALSGNSPNPEGSLNGSFQALGASPLAGSLSLGADPTGSGFSPLDARRRSSVTPFANAAPSESGSAPRSHSPAMVPGFSGSGASSRPTSSTGQGSGGKPGSNSPTKVESHSARAPPPGSLGPLPPSMFAGVKAVVSPGESVGSNGLSDHAKPVAPLPIAMEGLTHQGAHMGPPATLHDRVVFVSNLPLHMQWQELKDLLRPAGIIIRADVATDADGRPRGFGTALFATEKDATKAVAMYNNREIGGHIIRVHLERETRAELAELAGHDKAMDQARMNGLSPLGSNPSPSHESPLTGKLPWQLNTHVNGQHSPSRHPRSRETTPIHQSTYRPPHHPGPLSMPPFAPLDSPGGLGPLSPPLATPRGLPPMTPSMPGFVFNAYPETPPLHPHFLSPGAGPFSPGLPVSSPPSYQFNPYLNPAPGAPVNRYPGAQAGSAALGTPTTQAFPSLTSQAQSFGPPGGPGGPTPRRTGGGEYFPPIGTTMDPNSPISSLSSRSLTLPSPLNARDRLASTSSSHLNGQSSPSGDAMAEAAGQLSLKDEANGDEDANKTPVIAPAELLSVHPKGQGRMSMEERRPLGVWDGTERRASFGDVVAGRARP